MADCPFPDNVPILDHVDLEVASKSANIRACSKLRSETVAPVFRSNPADSSQTLQQLNEDEVRDRGSSIPICDKFLPHPTSVFYDNEDDSGAIDDASDAQEEKTNLSSTNELQSLASSGIHGVDMPELKENVADDLSSIERNIQWNLNYQEAAIYLQEGANNDKFDTHPRDQAALPAYSIVHNRLFYILELMVAIALMCLAFIESPSMITSDTDIVIIHTLLELFCLAVISVESGLKIRWMSPQVFVRHKRSMLKVVILVVMMVEAFVVLARKENHFRVTRALRPVFLIDCRYARGVRRMLRHIVMSLPAICEMCFLLIFFTFIFAILGNELFTDHDPDFGDLEKSFTSLFILFTTANYPDVMMRNYAANPANFIYFLVYLIIELYIIMNLLLAVVCNTFAENEEKKLKGLLLHRREACRRAFKLLNSKSCPNHISVKHYAGLMRYFTPRMSLQNVYLSFKALPAVNRIKKEREGCSTMDQGDNIPGLVCLEEFMHIYEVSELKWRVIKGDKGPWFSHLPPSLAPLSVFGARVNRFLRWEWSKKFVYVVLLVNAITTGFLPSGKPHADQVQSCFLAFYILEASLKIFGLGPKKYFRSAWNSFDFVMTLIQTIGLVSNKVTDSFHLDSSFNSYMLKISAVRPLRLLRVFKMRKRFRDVFATVFVLLPRMASTAALMILVYYAFAIVGMELFSNGANETALINCCANQSFAADYKNGTEGLYYYKNNFDNIFKSMVTLFELMVVNNWFIIMDAFSFVMESHWYKLFFMTFYLTSLVVINIVVAFILEAFTMRIDYKKKEDRDMDEDTLVKVAIELSRGEKLMIETAERTFKNWETVCKQIKSPNRPPPPLADALHGNFMIGRETPTSSMSNGTSAPVNVNSDLCDSVYRGTRSRHKMDFSIIMYSEKVRQWYEQSDLESRINTQGEDGTPLKTVRTPRPSTLSQITEDE